MLPLHVLQCFVQDVVLSVSVVFEGVRQARRGRLPRPHERRLQSATARVDAAELVDRSAHAQHVGPEADVRRLEGFQLQFIHPGEGRECSVGWLVERW